MQIHMKDVVPHRPRMPQKMLLHLLHPPLHLEVPLPRYRLQYPLQIRYILLEHENRERFPVQGLEERRDEIIGDDHGHALVEDGLHHSRTVDLEPPSTNAVLATLHVLHVARLALRFPYLAEDLHVGVLALPLPQQDRAEVAVHVAREEGEGSSLAKGLTAELPERILRRLDVRLGERRVFPEREAFFQVGVAE